MRIFRLTCALIFLCCSLATPTLAHATDQQTKPVCNTTEPEVRPHLPSRQVQGSLIEYYGRYQMTTPDGNRGECKNRQIIFYIGRLADDETPGKGRGPVVTLIVEHGIFHRRAKTMTIYNLISQDNGTAERFYTVDAESAAAIKGNFFIDISVVGQKPIQ